MVYICETISHKEINFRPTKEYFTNINTMPPIVQVKYCPLYRIDHWVTHKSYTDKRTQRSIYNDIKLLLNISNITLWRARRAQVGEEGTLSTADLIKLKDYFNCSLDDLVTDDSKDAYLPTPSSTSTPEEVSAGTDPQAL